MKVHLTHNTEIKTFDNVIRHLELEKDPMESSRPAIKAYVADARTQKNQGSKHKFKGRRGKEKGNASKKQKTNQQRKVPVKKDKSKLKCFNCATRGEQFLVKIDLTDKNW